MASEGPESTKSGKGGKGGYSSNDALADFETYEEYLDSFVQPRDLFYLEDEALARQLVELGCRGGGEALSRDEFQARKKQAECSRGMNRQRPAMKLAGAGKDLTGFPLLQALAAQEEAIRSGRLMVIVFIRDRNKRGQEISGFIDIAYRFKNEEWEKYFARRRRLLPRPTDLSYYNWESQTTAANHTPNFQVVSGDHGILFKSKRDRKVIDVDPEFSPGESTSTRRVDLKTDEYLQVIIFEHITRQKL